MQLKPETKRIRPRERKALIQALRAGVVPRTGLQHIQVGRAAELSALLGDIGHIADGGAGMRFVIGEYGSGKTFFLNLVRLVAQEKGLVTVRSDLTPDRRLQSTGGHARSLYAELMRNLSTRTKPDGGALASIVERFISETQMSAQAEGVDVETALRQRLSVLQELVAGYDFASVLAQYWQASEVGDAARKAAVLRWLRAEFANRTAARKELDVSTIIDDENWYDYLKLMARFVRLAGYGGLVSVFDEMVNLYKLHHRVSRTRNYEQILRIVNDSLQGTTEGLLILFGGTPEFLVDPYRGLYSYEALQSRLAENTFVGDGIVDLSGPVIRLQNLSPEDLYVLLQNIRRVFDSKEDSNSSIPDEALKAFMQHCEERIGEAYFRTPRKTISAFTGLLAVLEQNPGASWQDLLGHVEVEQERNPDLEPLPENENREPDETDEGQSFDTGAGTGDDELKSFTL